MTSTGRTNHSRLNCESAQRPRRRSYEPKICAWRRTAAASLNTGRSTSLAYAGRTGWRGRRAGPGSRRRRCSSRCTGPAWSGRGMAWFTGLAKRGPAAGVTVVFPDGWQEAWHPVRPPDAEPKLDDARFLLELATHLEGLGAASSWPVFLAGLSQGARYAEHIARHGLLPVTGLFLVAGTALECSRRLSPAPQLRVGMTLVIGTGDRTAPYEGGPLTRRGLSGLRAQAARGQARRTAGRGHRGRRGGPHDQLGRRERHHDRPGDPGAGHAARRPAGNAEGLGEAGRPAGHPLPGQRRRPRLARRPPVPPGPRHRPRRKHLDATPSCWTWPSARPPAPPAAPCSTSATSPEHGAGMGSGLGAGGAGFWGCGW